MENLKAFCFEIDMGGHVKNDFDCNRSGGSNPSFSARKLESLVSLQMENLKAFCFEIGAS